MVLNDRWANMCQLFSAFCYSLFSVAGSSVKRCQIAKDCEEMKDDFSENSGGLLQIARDLILD